ncbi:MAG: hypothetical protein ACE5FI_02110, partial [Anaerolineales bacterium]
MFASSTLQLQIATLFHKPLEAMAWAATVAGGVVMSVATVILASELAFMSPTTAGLTIERPNAARVDGLDYSADSVDMPLFQPLDAAIEQESLREDARRSSAQHRRILPNGNDIVAEAEVVPVVIASVSEVNPSQQEAVNENSPLATAVPTDAPVQAMAEFASQTDERDRLPGSAPYTSATEAPAQGASQAPAQQPTSDLIETSAESTTETAAAESSITATVATTDEPAATTATETQPADDSENSGGDDNGDANYVGGDRDGGDDNEGSDAGGDHDGGDD